MNPVPIGSLVTNTSSYTTIQFVEDGASLAKDIDKAVVSEYWIIDVFKLCVRSQMVTTASIAAKLISDWRDIGDKRICECSTDQIRMAWQYLPSELGKLVCRHITRT